jgi:Na+-transporting NADH:ubiquinone oxidoreductase subunit NqrD
VNIAQEVASLPGETLPLLVFFAAALSGVLLAAIRNGIVALIAFLALNTAIYLLADQPGLSEGQDLSKTICWFVGALVGFCLTMIVKHRRKDNNKRGKK